MWSVYEQIKKNPLTSSVIVIIFIQPYLMIILVLFQGKFMVLCSVFVIDKDLNTF
jgi:hypothetical protein